MAHSSILNIKENQNMILDLDPAKYDRFLQLIVECLRYLPLVIALTKLEIVPLVHLSKSYSTTSHQKGNGFIAFEIFNKKTQIMYSRFCNLLGLPHGCDVFHPESISNSAILEMFYQMCYKGTLTIVSKIIKPNLLPM
ncbi:unnamed protein product [Lactuca saligna]|uniref:Uncharacterized protein n=1 Tax=Lactuca saligna TaxID=75948 RepID=A0AA35V007_LACSI|nr:unnamed protein product [Lactuca saligna]